MITLGIAAAVLAVCAVLRHALERRRAGEWGAVRFHPLWNRGAAFGAPIGRRALLALSGLALPLIWLVRRRSPLGAGLLLGGGISNLWERLRHGRVFDYVQFPHVPGPWKRFVFNLADFAIFAGVLALLRGKR